MRKFCSGNIVLCFSLNHREINMCSEVLEKNSYHITWVIEYWGVIQRDFKSGKLHEIRSPVLRARNLDHTTWFISIKEQYFDTFVFFLNRSEDDGRAETVEIDWMMEIAGEGVQVNFKKGSRTINLFKKGTSNMWGEAKFIKRLFLSCTLKITCKILERLPSKKPVLDVAEIRSSKLFVPDLQKKSCILGPKNTELEFSFVETSRLSFSIRVRRIDTGNNIPCYLLFIIKICGKKGEVWSGKIDKMYEFLNKGDVFDYRLCKSEFLSSKTQGLCAYIEYMFIIINKNVIVTTSQYHKNPHKEFSSKHRKESTSKHQIISVPKSNSLVFDLIQMYENGIKSDVKLQVGSSTFNSHKCLLSARSPVFSAMFNQGMTENQTGIVVITDMEASTLSLLLKFIYTDIIDELDSESALMLLLASDKYQIISLKEMCSTYLVNVLSEKNVCEILNTADMIQHSGLKTSAMEYVKKYAHNILNSESWQQLIASNVSVVTETLGKISFDLWTTTDGKFVKSSSGHRKQPGAKESVNKD